VFLYQGKILYVDLDHGEVKPVPTREEWLDTYVGGMGLAFRYLLETLDFHADPLSPDNVLVFMTGPLAGTLAPLTSRLVLVSKSPKTETVFESNMGGAMAAEIKYAGFDGLIIKGKADSPVYLRIRDGEATIEDATDLWGKGIFETEKFLKEKEGDLEAKVMSIGPAGENQAPFACIGSECYRQFGRAGSGAIMGSKNLKAIVVRGKGSVKVADMQGFLDYVRRVSNENLMTDANLWAKTDGTPILVTYTNDLGILPVQNFQFGSWDDWYEIGTEAVKSIKARSRACVSCPLGCGNFVRFDEVRVEGPEYETLALAGANCGISDVRAIARFNELCDDLGLDTMSMGDILAFAMEMTERGRHDFGIRFGDVENYLSIPKEVAGKSSSRGRELALGVQILGKQFGGENMAVAVKNLELPAYDPRGNYGMGLAYATSERGACHLRAFTVFKENPFDIETMVSWVIRGQDFNSVKWSFGFCDFWASITPEILAEFLKFGMGKIVSVDEITKTGERIWNLIRLLNLKVGFDRSDDYLPSRLTEQPLRRGPSDGRIISKEDFETMLSLYYERRGWDDSGIPKPETLLKLGLSSLYGD